MSSVHIVTEFNQLGEIRQRMEFSMADNKAPDLMGEVSKKLLDLRDQGIKEALVQMGWTPPAPAAQADLIAKLARVSRWIDKFPVPTDGATAMMGHLRDVSEALAASPAPETAQADARGQYCPSCAGRGVVYTMSESAPDAEADCENCSSTGRVAHAQQDAAPADNAGFEAWARSHGGLPLDLAGDALRTDDGLALPTYKFGRTEIAWCAWSNRTPSAAAGKAAAANASGQAVAKGANLLGTKTWEQAPYLTNYYESQAGARGWNDAISRATTSAADAKDAERYKAQRDNLLAFIQNAQVSSGVCCCGDDMERHGNPMDCGHNPVDMWDHTVLCWVEEIKASDAAIAANKEGT